MTPLEAAWESLKDRAPHWTFEQFRQDTKGFDVFPVVVNSRLAGAIMVNGPEIHACILPFAHRRWFNKWAAGILNSVIEKHGFAQTHATTDAGCQFVNRLGFELQPDGAFVRRTKWEWNGYPQRQQ